MKETNERAKLLLKRMKLRREIITRLTEEVQQKVKEAEKHGEEIEKELAEVQRLCGGIDENDKN